MTKPILPLTQRVAWKELEAHYQKVRDLHLRQLFAEDPKRGERLTAEAVGLYLDYSKNRITDGTLKLLLQLAEESGTASPHRRDVPRRQNQHHREAGSFAHRIRAPKGASILVDGENVVPEVHAVLDRMADFSTRIRSGSWKGYTGKRIRNVINIGIGGSDLGPVMAYEALKHYSERDMTFRFISNIDGTDFAEATRDLDAAETLFIVSSKTFTTVETMTNARTRLAIGVCVRSATPRPRLGILSPFPPTEQRSPNSASTPPTCSASGTGSAAAIPWIQPSVYRP